MYFPGSILGMRETAMNRRQSYIFQGIYIPVGKVVHEKKKTKLNMDFYFQQWN